MGRNFLVIRPGEEFTIGVNFTNRLTEGRSVSSCTVAVTDMHDGTDISDAVIESTDATVSSNTASVQIQETEDGHKYLLTFTATLDNAETLKEEVTLWGEAA